MTNWVPTPEFLNVFLHVCLLSRFKMYKIQVSCKRKNNYGASVKDSSCLKAVLQVF